MPGACDPGVDVAPLVTVVQQGLHVVDSVHSCTAAHLTLEDPGNVRETILELQKDRVGNYWLRFWACRGHVAGGVCEPGSRYSVRALQLSMVSFRHHAVQIRDGQSVVIHMMCRYRMQN